MRSWRQAIDRLKLEQAWGISHLRRDRQRAAALLAALREAAEQEDEPQQQHTEAAPEGPAPATPGAQQQTTAGAAFDDQEEPATPWSLTSREAALEHSQRCALVEQRLGEMAAQVAQCERCAELQGRTRPAFSDGSPDSPIMFVGEAPGEQEDKSGVPFVGRAGQKLTEIIEKGMAHAIRAITGNSEIQIVPRSSVYICNVLKCRPPGNRDPKPDEVENCREYLSAQIDLVRPVVICALGLPASKRLLGLERPMHSLRGQRFELPERPEITVIPTYHPSYLLQQYTPENRKKVFADIAEVVQVLHEADAIPWWT